MTSTDLLETQTAATQLLAAVPNVALLRGCTDNELLRLGEQNALVQRYASVHGTQIAGEIARRSAPELGHAGLAQRQGERTPENLVRKITGSTKWEANTAVRVGKLGADTAEVIDLATGEVTPPKEPWLVLLVSALSSGLVSVPQADAIRTGLGSPTDDVPAERLSEQVETLIELAAAHDADWLNREARRRRDLIDEQGVKDREWAQHLKRSWKLFGRADGTGYSVVEHDAVTYPIMRDVYDRATSPRRGGPRFVDPARQAQATAFENDERTTEQIAHDAFLAIFEAGAIADDSRMLGRGGAQVRVIVTKESLEAGTDCDTGATTETSAEAPAYGFIDGSSAPVSVGTINSMICDGEVIPVVFDETGQAIDVGEKQRLFSVKQRIILAVMFGGCMFGDCDRPASWCEAHHILHVHRDGGTSVIDNGILLCRHHHLLLHNRGWEIVRTGDRGQDYWLIPPREVDPDQKPQLMRKKSAAYQQRFPERAPQPA